MENKRRLKRDYLHNTIL